MVIDTKAQKEKVTANLQASAQVKNLGKFFNLKLSLEPHIRDVTQNAFYNLTNFVRANTETFRARFIPCPIDHRALLSIYLSIYLSILYYIVLDYTVCLQLWVSL